METLADSLFDNLKKKKKQMKDHISRQKEINIHRGRKQMKLKNKTNKGNENTP